MSKKRGPITVLKLDIFDSGYEMGEADWEHVIECINDGCHGGELCPCRKDSDEQGSGWWSYTELSQERAAIRDNAEAMLQVLEGLIEMVECALGNRENGPAFDKALVSLKRETRKAKTAARKARKE